MENLNCKYGNFIPKKLQKLLNPITNEYNFTDISNLYNLYSSAELAYASYNPGHPTREETKSAFKKLEELKNKNKTKTEILGQDFDKLVEGYIEAGYYPDLAAATFIYYRFYIINAKKVTELINFYGMPIEEILNNPKDFTEYYGAKIDNSPDASNQSFV